MQLMIISKTKLQSCFYFKLYSRVEVPATNLDAKQYLITKLHLHLWLANIVVVKIKTNVAPLLHSDQNLIIPFGNYLKKRRPVSKFV